MGKILFAAFLSFVVSGCYLSGYKQTGIRPDVVNGECAVAGDGWNREIGASPFASADDHARANSRVLVAAGAYQYLCEAAKTQRARASRPYGWNAAAERWYRGRSGDAKTPLEAKLDDMDSKVNAMDKAQNAYMAYKVEAGKAEGTVPSATPAADQTETKATTQTTGPTRAQRIEAANSVAEIVSIYEAELNGKATADFIRRHYLPLPADKQAKLLPALKTQLTAKRGYMP